MVGERVNCHHLVTVIESTKVRAKPTRDEREQEIEHVSLKTIKL